MSPLGVATSRSTYALETGLAKLWLLLVGVNQYQDEKLPSLRYSAVDCQGLAEALADATQAFPQKEVVIYHDFATQQPILANLRASLEQIAANAQPQDTILFYFSGHGMLEPDTEKAVLCLADTQTENLLNTGLTLQELLQLMGNSKAQTQLVWLDACHSGGMTLRGAKAEIKTASLASPTPQIAELLRQRAKKSKGFYALLSCDNDQQSWEFPELGHGVFTYYLMRGLRGEAADSQGLIEADGLYRYVYYETLQYIEQTNQQLRLINQQKRSRGETQFFSEYPLQTPKRIVEGVGELILGLKPVGIEASYLRQALVVDGLGTSKTSLNFSKLLRGVGGFELEYLPRLGKTTTQDMREAIQNCLQRQENPEIVATVFLYLRGRIEETETGEAVLVLLDDIRLSRSWLRQQLRHSSYAQQIIILDCPGVETRHNVSLQEWVEDLQLGAEHGQCIIAASSLQENPEQFAQSLHNTLKVAQSASGLSVASWITQLQLSLANKLPLHIWLSGSQGVIEVIPARISNRDIQYLGSIDIGLCPYRGLKAFGEHDSQYFYGREDLTQELLNNLANKPFLAVVGASGSGKSSVIHAGVMAQLRAGKKISDSEQWWIGSLRPGTRPLEALTRRLSGDTGTMKRDEVENENIPASSSPYLILEGMLYQGVEGFVYWLRHRPEPMLVLVIDQFEELFTLASATDREHFLELVLGALELEPDKFKLIITLRADFIAACLEIPLLAKFLQQSSTLVPPCLSKEEYRRVIVSPAEQVGLTVEPELVEVLLQELQRSPGDLPLLEFVLEQLWEYRSAGELTLQAYQQHLGGIKGALERKAQALYESLDLEAQACARWIFLSLTQLGEGTEDTRRRILKSDLVVQKYPSALVERTLAALIAAKLIVVNLEEEENVGGNSRSGDDLERKAEGKQQKAEGREQRVARVPRVVATAEGQRAEGILPVSSSAVTVEVAHEVLIRHWSTLRWWLEENRSRLRSHRQIEQAAQLWKHNDEQSDFLLHGVRLAEAEDIYVNYTDELSGDVQRFIEAGLLEKQRQQEKEKIRLKQAQRTATVIGILGIAALGFAGLAFQQSRKAQLEEILALNSLSENYLLSQKPLEALISSMKAGRELQGMWFGIPADVRFKTTATLQQAVYTNQELNRLVGHDAWVSSVAFSPDGKNIASSSSDNTVILWQPNGKEIARLKGHGNTVNALSFSPDGTIIASASADQTIKLWSREGKLLQTLTGHHSGVNSVNFSSDGQKLISTSGDNTIKIWSRDGQILQTLPRQGGIENANFSPDGQAIASTNHDGTIQIWKSDGQLLATIPGHSDEALALSFSPDGKTFASGSFDGTIKIWDLSGKLLNTLKGHNFWVRSVSFSPDSKKIASASADRTVKLWSSDGTLLKTFTGHNLSVNSVSFSPDGQTLASASDDKTIRLWSVNQILPATVTGHKSDIVALRFSRDGKTLASASEDYTVKLWQFDQGGQFLPRLYKTLSGHNHEVSGVAFSPDGEMLASSGGDRTIKLWKRDGTLLKTLTGHDSWVISLAFSPDNQILASTSADSTIKLWKRDGTLLKTLTGHKSWVTNVAFTPDGQILASSSADNTIKLWKRDGTLIKTLTGHGASVWSVNFSLDGELLASTSQDTTIKLWSRDGILLKTLEGHTDEISYATFSPDGKMIASSSDDDTIKLWSRDGTLLKTLEGHKGNVRSVVFSKDSKMIVSGGQDATIKLWRLDGLELQTSDLRQLLQRGCDRLRDYLQTNPNVTTSDRQMCS